MYVAVLGGAGQLGLSLKAIQPTAIEATYYDSQSCDITSPAAIAAVLQSGVDVIINAAAYTNVDGAESDRETAFAINATAAGELAQQCSQKGLPLIHISTDFVFDGKGSTPYNSDDPTAPLSVYGASKLEGERLVLQSGPLHRVIRTSWLYSPWQSNFVKTMLRLMATRDELAVVEDEVGSPTSALSLAGYIWRALGDGSFSRGEQLLHYCDAGECSRYQFAKVINQLAVKSGLLEREIVIGPTTASALALPAKRPSYSTLRCSSDDNPAWQQELERLFMQYPNDWL